MRIWIIGARDGFGSAIADNAAMCRPKWPTKDRVPIGGVVTGILIGDIYRVELNAKDIVAHTVIIHQIVKDLQ